MKRLLLVLASVFLVASVAQATTYYYQSGNMDTLASWSLNRDGSGGAPTAFSGNSFVIQNGQSATANAGWTTSNGPGTILIETGGSMTSGAFNPVITLSMQTGASYTSSNNTWSNLTLSTVNAGSTFTAAGASTTLIDRAYGNLIWQSSGGDVVTANNLTTTGSLTISSGAPLRTATGTSARLWTIGDSLAISSGSTWNLTNGTTTGTGTINIANGLTNSGMINKSGTAAATVSFTGSGSSNVTWGSVTNDNFSNTTFNVNSSKIIVFVDSLNEGAAAFNVSGTLNIGAQTLSGTGVFTLASGGTLITSSATGLNGAITVTGTKSFSTGANYEFQGAGTGSLLPSTVNNLTINRNSGNVTLDGGSAAQTVSGALNVYSGNLAAGTTTNGVSVGSLTMRDAQINSGLTVTLDGNVAFDGVNNGTATIAGNLNLGGASRTFTVANGSAATDMSVSGTVSNGDLIKAGAGSLSLSADNSGWSGGTTINAGTLTTGHDNALGSGSATVNSGGILAVGDGLIVTNDITVASGGILAGNSSTFTGTIGGNGTLSGSIAIGSGGSVSPGNSPGNLTVAAGSTLTFDSGSTFAWQLDSLVDNSTGTAGTHWDVITLSTNTSSLVATSGLLAPAFTGSATAPGTDAFWNSNHSWTVVANSNGGSITGSFTVNNSSWSNYGTFGTSGTGTDNQTLTWTAAAIPEPSTYAALLGGAMLAWVTLRRRRVLSVK